MVEVCVWMIEEKKFSGERLGLGLPPLIRKTTRDKKKVGVGGGCVVEVCVCVCGVELGSGGCMVDEIIKKIEKSKKSAGNVFFIWARRYKSIIRNLKKIGWAARSGFAARFGITAVDSLKPQETKKSWGERGLC